MCTIFNGFQKMFQIAWLDCTYISLAFVITTFIIICHVIDDYMNVLLEIKRVLACHCDQMNCVQSAAIECVTGELFALYGYNQLTGCLILVINRL